MAEDETGHEQAWGDALLKALHELDAVIEVDGDGTVSAWNSRAEALFGWPATEAVGEMKVEQLIADSRRALFLKQLSAHRGTGGAASPGWREELELLHRDGHEHRSEVTIIAGAAEPAPAFLMIVHGDARRDA